MKARTVPDSRGLVPAIHVFLCRNAPESKTWMPATSVDERGHDDGEADAIRAKSL
jgi:hypothetical protein